MAIHPPIQNDERPERMADDSISFNNTHDLLQYLEQLDVRLTIHEGRLACSAPKGVLTPQLQQSLSSHKSEILRILQDGNQEHGNPSNALPHYSCIHELIAAQSARTPEAVAVIAGNQRLTYHELDVRATDLARRISQRNLQPQSLVGICLDRSVDMVVALLAVHKAGAAYLPLDPEFPADRLAFMLEDSAASLVITQRNLATILPGGRPEHFYLDDAPELTHQRSPFLPVRAADDGLAYVLYTSGSSGKPKGVAVEHRSVTNFLNSMQSVPGISPQDRLLAVTTLSFDIAGLELFLPLITGAQLILAPRTALIDGATLGRLLQDSQATMMQATPVTWRLLLDSGWNASPHFKMLCGGEALSRELANRLLATGAELWNLYGPTETTIWSTVYKVGPGNGSVPIGRPIANTQVYVLDEGGHRVPRGVPGELCIGGAGVARGYLNRPEDTAARFVPDPFQPGNRMYRTGDIVRQGADDNLEYLGRNDQQVKLRGFRIELGEIETLLEQQPGVQQAVAIVREDNPGDQRIAAYITPRDAGDSEMLRAVAAAGLPQYMVPSSFTFLDAIPLTLNKKVDRNALPAPHMASSAASQAEASSPATDMEEKLASIWQTLLKVPAVAPHDNFFSLGGHSLLIVELQSAVRLQLAREVSIPDLFQRPTVAELAEFLETIPTATDSTALDNTGPLRIVTNSKPSDNSELNIQYLNDGPNIGAEALFTKSAISHTDHDHSRTCLVVAQPKGTRTPLFMVAGFQGPDDTLFVLSRIIPHVGADQPIYGFRPRWVRGGELYANVEEEASEYLAALRAIQPKGPYRLGGYCLSGLVAFEMARQLIGAGEQIDLLALIDTERPSNTRTLVANAWNYWERAQHMGAVVRDLGRRNDPQRSSAAWNTVRRKLQISPASKIEDPHEAFYRAKMSYQSTIREYVPQEYPGRLTLIVNEHLYRSSDRFRGWRGFPAREIVVHKVSGDHITMFKEHGRELAHLLLESTDLDAGGKPQAGGFASASAK